MSGNRRPVPCGSVIEKGGRLFLTGNGFLPFCIKQGEKARKEGLEEKDRQEWETAVLAEGLEALRQRLSRLEEENEAFKQLALETYGELEEAKTRLSLLEDFRRNRLHAGYLFIGLDRPGLRKGSKGGDLQLFLSRDGLEWGRLYQGEIQPFLAWAAVTMRRGEGFFLDGLQPEPVFALQGTDKWLRFCRRENGEGQEGERGARSWTVWLAADRNRMEAGRFLRLHVPCRLPPQTEAGKVTVLSLEEYRKLEEAQERPGSWKKRGNRET